jgi:hypothetical protein
MSRIPDQLVKISERLVRAEGLLARQRDHIRQRQEAGLDVEKFLALLLVWEQIVEQFHISRGLLRSICLRLGPDERLQGRLECENSSPPFRPLRRTEPVALRCPHCSLTLLLKDGRNGALVYDVSDWHRLCKQKALVSPALCQLTPWSTVALH